MDTIRRNLLLADLSQRAEMPLYAAQYPITAEIHIGEHENQQSSITQSMQGTSVAGMRTPENDIAQPFLAGNVNLDKQRSSETFVGRSPLEDWLSKSHRHER